MSVNCIVAKNVTKNIVNDVIDINLLTEINFELTQGDTAAIVGVSGSGKTTLLGVLAGLDAPSSGVIKINGQDLTILNDAKRTELRSKNIGFIFQNFQLLPHMTVLENVMLPLELQYDKLAKSKAVDILAKVGLQDRIRHLPNQLSGGEQQRVSIARAFVTRPKILLADEPTGNLDENTANKIINLIFELNKEHHTTLILVTHDMNLANLCNNKYKLEHGKLSIMD